MKYIKRFNESISNYNNTQIDQIKFDQLLESIVEFSESEIEKIRLFFSKYITDIVYHNIDWSVRVKFSYIYYNIHKLQDDWYLIRRFESLSGKITNIKCDTIDGVFHEMENFLINYTKIEPSKLLGKDDNINLKGKIISIINGLNYEDTKIVNDFVSKLISDKDIKVNESKSEYNNLNIMSTTFESLVKSNVEFEESEFKKIMDFFAKYRIIINKYDRNHKIVANGHNRYYSIFKLEDDWFLIKLYKGLRNDETTYKKCDSLDGVFSEVEKEFIEISKVNPDNFIKSVKNYRDNTQLKNKVISKVNKLTPENIQKVIDFINGLD